MIRLAMTLLTATPLATVFVALMLCICPPAVLAQADSPGGDLKQELAGIHSSLREIASLLRQQLGHQELDLFLKRIELGQLSIAPLERQVEGLREQHEDTQEEREQLLDTMEVMAKQRDAEEEGNSEMQEQYDIWLRQTGRRLEGLKDKIWRLEQELIEPENRLKRRQRDLRDLEAIVDEKLGLR